MDEPMEGIMIEDTRREYQGDICYDCGSPGEICDCDCDCD